MQIYVKKHRYKLTKTKILYYLATMITVSIIILIHNTSYSQKSHTIDINQNTKKNISIEIKQKPSVWKRKYMLLWTNSNNYPFIYLGKGNSVFVERKCQWTNCYVTADRHYLGHYTEFDVVAFNGPQLSEVMNNDDLPRVRRPHQKYVYANIEAEINYPICSTTWDGFFNWTWTYKLNSDSLWGYITVKNSSGHVIAPNLHVDWIKPENMDPISELLRNKLKSKNKAAAWFVSNCRTMSGREQFVNELRNYLNYYNLDVDIYGDCGGFQCSKDTMKECLQMLEEKYYFYFAFENAISEDYVTEKILHALHHYTVPVVFGGANYTRFLPPGAYLNARELGTRNLAQQIFDVTTNPAKYRKFFRWRKYYSYHFRHESPQTDDYCRFCAIMNDEYLMNKTSIYYNFSSWWSAKESCAVLTAQDDVK